MSTTPAPAADDDSDAEFVRLRVAAGQPEFITDPTLYRILDGVMADHLAEADPVRADRRRRAVKRSQARVPYD